MRRLNSDPNFRERSRERVVERNRKGHKETGIERKVREHLERCEVEFEQECRLLEYAVDFYIPKVGLVIECDGEYWHSRQGVRERDVLRDEKLHAAGIAVLRFSESEINQDWKRVSWVLDRILGGCHGT